MWGRKSWRCRPCLLTMKTLAPQLCCEFHPDLSRDLAGHLLPVPCRIQNVLRIMPMPWYQGRLGQCRFFCHRPHRIFTLSSLGVTVKEIDRGKFPGPHDLCSCHPDQVQKDYVGIMSDVDKWRPYLYVPDWLNEKWVLFHLFHFLPFFISWCATSSRLDNMDR